MSFELRTRLPTGFCRRQLSEFRRPRPRQQTASSKTTSMSDDRAAELKGTYLSSTFSHSLHSYFLLFQRGWLPATRTSENPGFERWRLALSMTSSRVAIVLRASTTMRPAASSRRSILRFLERTGCVYDSPF